MMELSQAELARYNRHIILSEVGLEGQLKLKQAKVLVVGVGGLGCPIAQYLVGAGVGEIGLVDDDTVSESNLQRQLLFDTRDLGRPKAEVAQEKLGFLNPHVKFNHYRTRLDSNNALEIVQKYDILVDGTDNFPTRYLLNDVSVIANKVLVYGSIFKYDGQVSVFNYRGGPTYRCLFPEPPEPGSIPNCAQVGVIGVLPGIIGSLQANEVIKLILGIGEPLSGKLLCVDLLTLNQQVITFEKSYTAKIETLIDYEDFCGLGGDKPMPSISVDQLQKLYDSQEEFQLIDVREPFEFEIAKLERAILIPLSTMENHVSSLRRDVPVVVYCHHGMRSASAIAHLTQEYGFNNLKNLEGGIDAWSREVDETIARY